MTQERLNDLGLLSIKMERFKDIDRTAIGRICANAKARKCVYYFSLIDIMTATMLGLLAEVSYVF